MVTITRKAKLAFYALIVALLATVAFGFPKAEVQIGDALKIERPVPAVHIADAYKVTR